MEHQQAPMVPWQIMPIQWPGPHHGQNLLGNEAPARVRMAAAFLNQMTMKTAAGIAANDVGFERLEGQQLTDEEAAAQATAANVLSEYFAGKLAPDGWEDRYLEQHKPRGTVVLCPTCPIHSPDPGCSLCRGHGKISVTPYEGK